VETHYVFGDINASSSTGDDLPPTFSTEAPAQNGESPDSLREARGAVVVIVLNWNNLPDTLECLESLERSDYKQLHIWVVDNGSDDDPTAVLQAGHPRARVLRNSTNLGYGGGNNVGLRAAIAVDATYVLLLNNDVVVAPDMVSRLVAAAEANRLVGMATPVVFYYDRPTEIYWDGGFIDWKTGEAWHESSRFPAEHGRRPSEWLDGCVLLVRVASLGDVGLLDDRYFLYFEDADWSIRSARRGWLNVVALDARAWHKVSRSTGGKGNPAVRFYYARNRYFFLRAHGGSVVPSWWKCRYGWTLLREYRALIGDREGRRAVVSAALSILRDRWGSADSAIAQSRGLIRMLDTGVLAVLMIARTIRRLVRLRTRGR
jgi:GT2 family glycosyltransferase